MNPLVLWHTAAAYRRNKQVDSARARREIAARSIDKPFARILALFTEIATRG